MFDGVFRFGMTVWYTCAVVVFHNLRYVTSTGGPLESLSSGVSGSSLTESQKASLHRWQKGLMIAYTLLMLMTIAGFLPRIISGEGFQESAAHNRIAAVAYVIFASVFWAAVLGWWLSLKLGSALAKLDVLDVAKRLGRNTSFMGTNEQEWLEEVVQPALALDETFGQLSAWGNALGLFGFGIWVGCFALVWGVCANPNHAPAFRAIVGVIALVMTLFPLLLALDPARVSSDSDILVDATNDLNFADIKMFDRTFPMLFTLKNTNIGQGIGFTIFKVVVDTVMLKKLIFGLWSFFTIVFPVLYQYLPEEVSDVTTESCVLTEAQEALVRAMVNTFNSTCSYNMTIASVVDW